MYKKVLLIVFSGFIIACSGPAEIRIPDNVLPKEKMAEVMVDIHLLEASMNTSMNMANPAKIDVAAKKNVQLNLDVFKKHHITKKQYDESFAFYTNNPKFLSDVYQLVLNDLSKMQAKVMNEK